MSVNITRTHVFSDGSTVSPLALDSELDIVASTVNNANAGLLTWDHVKSSTLTVWTQYTPTLNGFGTCASIAFYWRRIGDTIDVRGTFTTGTAAGSTASFTLPNSVTVDSTKMGSADVASGMVVGINQAALRITLAKASSNLVYFGWANATNTYSTHLNGSSVAGNSETLSLTFSAPITTWTF